MVELFGNLARTTINQVGGINTTSTSVVVSALNGSNTWNSFPSSGNFRVVFGTDNNAEIALCTAVNTTTNTLTLVRGQEGSIAQTWANGTAVTLSLTSQSINQSRSDLFSVGSFANLPSQGLPTGSYYKVSDSPWSFAWDPNKGAWCPDLMGILGTRPPSAANWTAVGATGTTLIDDHGTLLLSTSLGSGSNDLLQYNTALPSTFIVVAAVTWTPALINPGAGNEPLVAICFRNAASGKFYRQGCYFGSENFNFQVQEFLNVSSASTVLFTNTTNAWANSNTWWYMCVQDNVNISFYYSNNGIDWYLAFQHAKNTFTTVDHVGFWAPATNGLKNLQRLLSFSVQSLFQSPIQQPVLQPPPPAQIPPSMGLGFVSPIFRS